MAGPEARRQDDREVNTDVFPILSVCQVLHSRSPECSEMDKAGCSWMLMNCVKDRCVTTWDVLSMYVGSYQTGQRHMSFGVLRWAPLADERN